ncbi:MAG TPA: SH3 domain-containing protein [Polyangiaceae bacterium]|nr:SH3 domain-containing protein [Polyangiaceae bacterium]
MATSRRQPALKVEVPRPSNVPLRLGRVGLIAVVGFLAGIVWPRLAGLRLVPTLPAPTASSQDLTGAPPDEQPAASALASAVPAPSANKPEPLATGGQPPVVGEALVTSCRDASGGKIEHCDAVDFDRVARDRLSSLDDCPAAKGVSGVLSLGFDLDFTTERITRITSGKATSLADEALQAVLECYRQDFANVSLVAIPHQHQRYSVFYRIELAAAPPEAPAAASAAPVAVTPASGNATVSWETALVHATPEKDGKVVARVLSGTRVGVTGRSGDWYRVKYDARGREGWVFRTAIGM